MSANLAPAGTVWVCSACGKRARDKIEGGIARGWDSSCFTHAVLCEESSVIVDDTGRVTKASAVVP